MSNNAENAQHLQSAFDRVGQGHVFTFWEKLALAERDQLLADLAEINIEQIPNLIPQVRSEASLHPLPTDLGPPTVILPSSVPPETRKIGVDAIAAGKVAALTVAGGQGTRLGFDGPKGALPISVVQKKSLFQLFAESVVATNRKYHCTVPWYIMTSPANDSQTRDFFQKHNYFGLTTTDVIFFQQGVMPAFDKSGRILLEQKHRVALSPDGHGGSLLAMARSGVLADMTRRGIEHISYFQVDNPLVNCIDPLFLGLHISHKSEMSSKTLPKADDLEKVGNFAMSGNQLIVVEYSDFPDSLAHAKNANGARKYDAANIAIHILSRAFVKRLTADTKYFGLPWHRAVKKVPYVDMQNGQQIQSEAPNAIKLEAFIFDALPLARNAILLQTSRDEEFSPVKNKTGVDSIETAQRDFNRRATRWLEKAGVAVRHNATGEPMGRYEISSLYALEADDLSKCPLHEDIMQKLPQRDTDSLYLE